MLGALGGFAAAVPLPTGLREPLLVTATDGVGTKTEIARLLGRRDTIGADLVAMCVDDLVCHGARPLWFLDYLAVGRVVPEAVAEVVAGISRACASVGCELVGGETAEHPGLMAEDAFDLAGFAAGVVERAELIDGRAARERDIVLGLASSGLHANGYSLVRAMLVERSLRLGQPVGPGLDLGEALLTATRIYAAHILALLGHAREDGFRIGGLAHVTGGGLAGNLPRSVMPSLGITVTPGTWPVPPVIELVRRAAGMAGPELRATFNAGIGMAVVVEPDAARSVLTLLEARGVQAWPIGQVVAATETGPSRYIETA